jgi:hypothetical protein
MDCISSKFTHRIFLKLRKKQTSNGEIRMKLQMKIHNDLKCVWIQAKLPHIGFK